VVEEGVHVCGNADACNHTQTTRHTW
jgi:hypothetical protein